MVDMSATCTLGSGMLNLPGRLDKLLQCYRDMLPKGAEDEIPLIKCDLERIIALQKSEEDYSAAMVKCLMKEVRELLYDVEDFLDQYEYAAAGFLQDGGITRPRIPHRRIIRWRRSKRTHYFPEKLRQRLWMANKIREFSKRAQEALERHEMYVLHRTRTACSRSLDPSSIAQQPTPVVDDAQNHVGIDLAINKLEEWLTTMHGTGVNNLKVVSVVGFRGVGKTLLAKELYHKLGSQYKCRAFVQVSQKPDMRRVFISILSQICPHQRPDNWKVHNLISSIRTHLQHRRYLIIVDDLWATSTWEIIKSSLPDGKNHSSILTTTEIEDLALHCSGYDSKYVFNLKPLDEDDSRTLFFSSVFGPQSECPLQLREVSEDITRKCGGLPLAIVTIASMLTDYLGTQEQWDYVSRSLGCSLMNISAQDRIKQIFDLCYNNLPHSLKACMLYTSIYEAGNIIQKDDLVNEWIAEGFICVTEGQDRQEISRGYFDELVHRRMIQPVDIDDRGEIQSCVVNHTLLILIMEKSLKENFVTAIHHSQATTLLADKVRRLSLQYGNAEYVMPATNMRLSQVRTLAFFGVFKCMPSIEEFRLLQVLILHFWGDNDTIHLDMTRISELFRLKYLKIASNVNIQLHTQMQGLQSLETLQIDTRVTAVLSDITHLHGSLHLRCPVETNLPNWIGHMTSLRTLGCVDLSTDSLANLQNLDRLTSLQDIRLTCCSTVLETGIDRNKMKNHLLSIIGKLGNLRSLTLVSKGFPHVCSLDIAGSKRFSISNHGFNSMHTPTLLQRLELSTHVFVFSRLPNFIGELCNLCFLKIGINKITMDDMNVLRRLRSLAVLSLYVHTKLAERIVIGKDGCSVLKYFKFKSCDPWLKFEMGAMSNLQKLKLVFNARSGDQQSMIMPVGMEHLLDLKEVSAKIGGATNSEASDRKTAELAFRDAIRVHTRCPRVTILHVNRIIGSMDDAVNIKREEEYNTRNSGEVLDGEDSVSHDEIVENSRKERNKHMYHRSTAEALLERPQTERVAFRIRSEVEILDDGYRWKKYGMKPVKNSPYPRNYYRCSTEGCKVKKQVARDKDDPSYVMTTYKGTHNHVPWSTTPARMPPSAALPAQPGVFQLIDVPFPIVGAVAPRSPERGRQDEARCRSTAATEGCSSSPPTPRQHWTGERK